MPVCRPIRTWIGPRDSAFGHRLCSGERSRRRGKGEEERVALRVHLDPTFDGARLADHAAVLGQRLGVRLGPELVQQLRRALDVREEEGDGAGGKVGTHGLDYLRVERPARYAVCYEHAHRTPPNPHLPEQRRRLEAEAQRRGSSVATVVREAIDATVTGPTREERRAAVAAIKAMNAKFLTVDEMEAIIAEEREAAADPR